MVIPGGKCGTISLLDARLYFFDKAAEVAVLHIRLHEDAQPAILARDFARAVDAIDLGNFARAESSFRWASKRGLL